LIKEYDNTVCDLIVQRLKLVYSMSIPGADPTLFSNKIVEIGDKITKLTLEYEKKDAITAAIPYYFNSKGLEHLDKGLEQTRKDFEKKHPKGRFHKILNADISPWRFLLSGRLCLCKQCNQPFFDRLDFQPHMYSNQAILESAWNYEKIEKIEDSELAFNATLKNVQDLLEKDAKLPFRRSCPECRAGIKASKNCVMCGKPLPKKSKRNAETCSEKCRQRKSRRLKYFGY
jgi:predicted nucleic acid-binding Zn ribbon protein